MRQPIVVHEFDCPAELCNLFNFLFKLIKKPDTSYDERARRCMVGTHCPFESQMSTDQGRGRTGKYVRLLIIIKIF